MAAPLTGLTVIALEQAVAAPFCTSRLADNGARVIKVERAEGDFARGYDNVVHGESAYFVWLNRGKESLALDIKQPDDARLLHAMIASADVFVQNLAPGATARAGFGSETLRARHPRLITCDISGYGEVGPWAEMKAYDLLIQCESGLAAISGSPDAPGRVGVSIADISCGMYAHAAILQALYVREKTGLGDGIAVSLFDCLADWMTVPLLHHDYGGQAPKRVGLNHPSIAPYGVYHAGDGRQLVLAVQNEREWKVFCESVLHCERLADDHRFISNSLRCANRVVLDTEIEKAFRALSTAEVIERLKMARIAFGRVNEVADLSVHPQLRRIEVTTPTGNVSMPAPPARWADGRKFPTHYSPAVNEHRAGLRGEFIHDD